MVGAISAILPNIALSGSVFSPPAASSAGVFGADFLLGAVAASRTGPAAAYDALGKPLAGSPNSPTAKAREANLNVAQLSIKLGDYAAARSAAQRVLARDPNDVTANYYIARIDQHEGDYEGAEKTLLRITTIEDNDQVRSDLRSVHALRKGAETVSDEIDRLLSQSSTAKQGLQLADDFLNNSPDNVKVRLQVAGYYEKQGNLNLAGAELSDAIKNVPSEGRDEVVAHLEKFAAAHAEDRGSFDLLAQGYAAAGRLDDAARAFNRALELSEDDIVFQSQVKKDFADVYSRLGRESLEAGHEDEALAAFRKASGVVGDDERRKDLSDLQFKRGQRLNRQGLDQLALKALNESRANIPIADRKKRGDELIKEFEKLAQDFHQNGDLKNAVSARAGAYNLDAKNTVRKRALADSHNDYGLELLGQSKYLEAIRQFKAATKLFGDDTNYAANLSLAQSHL
jgi:tetratricopeptide (TPR) repeat protein